MFIITKSGYTEITENVAETMMDISMRNRGKSPFDCEYMVEASPERYKVTESGLVAKTDDELVADGLMTAAELTEKKAEKIRAQRKSLFAAYVDTINAVRWSAMSTGNQTIIAAYRQALCDITAQSTFPDSVVWPEIPAILSEG